MALKSLSFLRFIKTNHQLSCHLRLTTKSNIARYSSELVKKLPKENENLIYKDDPDTFGTLSYKTMKVHSEPEDEDDFKEENYLEHNPLPTQKLTTKQYADLIKEYLKHKRLKQAIEVLEVRMLTQDKVSPENYIYNILIGACADLGYTKKAFSLYNDMKRRALKPTGDTYTCLFNACSNSPWPSDGVKRAKHLKELMFEKGIEANITNYNAMIKAFGRCGDLSTAFQIVDEMKSKGIKIRVHTFNFLLQACISDKDKGLRHALVVWRHMLKMREKPNIYTFNLMLKCVKECNLGTKDDIAELIEAIEKIVLIDKPNSNNLLTNSPKCIESPKTHDHTQELQLVDINNTMAPSKEAQVVPNLLSKLPNLQQVLALQEITTAPDKFAVVGGAEDFLKQMNQFSVKPDVKTFTQMLFLLEDSVEAEDKLMEYLKKYEIRSDIDFYNMLIKKRCLRKDYTGAFEVRDLIAKENKYRKKKHFLKKDLVLKCNVMTYGVLAMACDTKEQATKLVQEMKDEGLKMNAEILGTLLRQGTYHYNFSYVLYILNTVKNENLPINEAFLRHLEQFNEKCSNKLKDNNDIFAKAHHIYQMTYKRWLKEVNVEDALKQPHPWQQFKEDIPEPLQRQNLVQEPKKYYKKRFKKYNAYIVK